MSVALPVSGQPVRGRKPTPSETARIVLDADDRIVRVGAEVQELMGPFIGRVLWERLPGAEPLLRPGFDRARESGEVVEFTVYYAGRVRHYRATPAGDKLAVVAEHLTELDVTSLATLARTLSLIEVELAAPAHEQRGEPAPSSPRAPL